MTKWISRFVVLSAFLTGECVGVRASFAGGRVCARQRGQSVSGAFKAFRLVNPHSTMKLDVKSKDGSTGSGRSSAAASGKSRGSVCKDGPNALKPGDEIIVTIVPAIDGKSPVGLLSAITYKDGHTVRFRSPDE